MKKETKIILIVALMVGLYIFLKGGLQLFTIYPIFPDPTGLVLYFPLNDSSSFPHQNYIQGIN